MRPVIIQKQKIVQEIQTNIQNSKAIIFYNFHHLDNEKLFTLKKDLKKIGGCWKVYKNTLIRKALMNKKNVEFTQANAVIFCQQDEYQPLKILNKFDQEYSEENKIKGGWYEEDYVSGETLVKWAKLPSKTELLKTFCYYLTYNLRRMANLLEKLKNQPKQSKNINMDIDKQKKKETFFEITDSLTSLELSEYSEDFKKRYGIEEVAFVSTAQEIEGQKTASSANVSLKIVEIGKQPIPLYGAVKDIINKATGSQINIVNAMQIVKQQKPILENIPRAKADEYKKLLEEGETEEEKKQREGVKVEIIE